MKKAAALLMLVWVLTACGGENRELEEAMAFRNALLSAQGCSFSLGITADYGDIVQEFSMDCSADALGKVTFTVTEPETIAGITGTLSELGGELTFEDTVLHFKSMAEGTLSPVSAPWLLLRTLRSGCITSVCREAEQLRMSIDDSYADDALRLDIWLDEDKKPLRAEVLHDGLRILTLTVTSFRIL